jgi:uncharacterized protein
MLILSIEHEHFTLEVELADSRDEPDFEKIFLAAFKRHMRKHFITKYEFSSKDVIFRIWQYNNTKFEQVDISKVTYPVFFENTAYKINLDFIPDVLHPFIYTKLKSLESLFRIRTTRLHTYSASAALDFGNEPGNFELNINYQYRTVPHSILFRFEVYPVKLNFKRDFPAFLKQIDAIYPRLVIDHLKKTYHYFELDGTDHSDILWWIIFTNLFRSIVRHVTMIVENPYKSSGVAKKNVKAWKVKKAKGPLADKLERFAGEPDQYFQIAGVRPMEDNYENQYVKYIITEILSNYKAIYTKVIQDSSFKRIAREYRIQLEFSAEALSALLRHTVFKSVKELDGRSMRSQVLQSRPGYAGLLKDWKALRKGYRLLDGLYEMELKDIAYLYQVWCFFGIADMIKRITGVSPDIRKMPVVRKPVFRLSQHKDVQSKMIFRCPDGTVVELYQELRYTGDFGETNAGTMDEQVCPDIILRIGKKDQPRNLYMTYLFDAKYRLKESSRYKKMDEPLQKDLEQMSNYKEVIYNRREQDGGYEYTKEIAAAYVLYPGKSNAVSFRKYYEDIVLKSNRGGFPFLPYNKTGMAFLEEHLRMLIRSDSKKQLDSLHIPKGLTVKNTDAYVLVIPIPASDQAMITEMIDQVAAQFPCKTWIPAIGEGPVRYLAIYVEGRGIICYYEITAVNMKAWRDIYPPMHPLFRNEGRRHMVLKLGYKELLDAYVPIKGMANNKRYTQIKHLYRLVNGFVRTISPGKVAAAMGKSSGNKG